jgi:hypothetical protein
MGSPNGKRASFSATLDHDRVRAKRSHDVQNIVAPNLLAAMDAELDLMPASFQETLRLRCA